MSRRPACNSPRGQIELYERLQTKIESPIELNDEETEIFDGIIAELPMDAWEFFRIRRAAELAKLYMEYDTLLAEALREGAANLMGVNPKLKAAHILFTQTERLSRLLGISASQRGISPSTMEKRREAEREAKDALKSASGGLLA